MAKLPEVFERYRAEIDAELKSALAERHLPLYDMMRYHFGWMDKKGNPQPGSAGKALRPVLCLLACEAAGGEYQRALPAAAALELVHNYSLIHDDIQDDDRERRHRPTVWSIWGKPQAINVGTAMRLLANRELLRLRGIPLEKQMRVQELLDEATLRLIEGQYLDISYESRFDIGVDDYLRMIEGKTAALIACCLEVGALLATDDERVAENLGKAGRSLGLAFQVRDDILGIWGNKEETGKPLGNDILRRKKTFPIVYALQEPGNGLRTELVEIYRKEELSEGDLAAVLSILEAVGAQAAAQRLTRRYCEEARQTLDKAVLVPSAKRDLEELVSFLAERDF